MRCEQAGGRRAHRGRPRGEGGTREVRGAVGRPPVGERGARHDSAHWAGEANKRSEGPGAADRGDHLFVTIGMPFLRA